MIYINGRGCVSAQKTFDGSFPDEVIAPEGYILPVVPPPYKDYIAPAMIRRMGSGVKNGVVASALALQEAGSPDLDAIITGTGVGCIKDSEAFLTAILENHEEFLTPTAFIQSTHNTVGAQIALGLGCKAYNFSYVNSAVSFESALVDARLQLLSEEARTILVGGVDEKADYTYHLFGLAGLIKTGEGTPGASYSEGAAFFVLSTDKQEESYGMLKDVAVMNCLEPEAVAPALEAFLRRTGTALADIDAVVIGKNDDPQFQEYYSVLSGGFSPEVPVIHYKHLSGEYNTASAFGFWLAAGILKSGYVPEAVLLSGQPGLSPGGAASNAATLGKIVSHEEASHRAANSETAQSGAAIRGAAIRGAAIRHILLYNQYRGIDHSFILLSGC
ncbi:MAG: beta-ketoacyl synthase chain length factor [Leadbetterella sp.]|nr:beta-ketoacyl synthase chain length factor [Leadbetterella sp.]